MCSRTSLGVVATEATRFHLPRAMMPAFSPATLVQAKRREQLMTKTELRGSRGPARGLNSTIKVACAYKLCKSGRDCKNVSENLRASRKELLQDKCRAIRSHCAEVRFCCSKHLNLCTTGAKPQKRGQREELTDTQMSHFLRTCLTCGYPWLAVLSMLQTVVCERTDCMRNVQVGWFRGLDPQSGQPPMLAIPAVNEKTKPREVPLPSELSRSLHMWINSQPLQGQASTTWPFQGQDLSRSTAILFPGMIISGPSHGKRDWQQPVSERGYLKAVTVVAAFLEKERQESRRANVPHCMEGVSLRKIGTHSFKATGVTLLRENGHSAKVASAIAGTSEETIERYYHRATRQRQRKASEETFSQIAQAPGSNSDSPEVPARTVNFCSMCGKERLRAEFCFCPYCGQKF